MWTNDIDNSAPAVHYGDVDYDGDVDQLQQRLIDNGILGGVKVGESTIMFAVTEKRTKEEIDKLVELTKEETR